MSPPAAGPHRALHIGINEPPAHPVESRDGVPVDEVDPLSVLLSEQRRPLVGALPATDDDDPGASQFIESDRGRRCGSPAPGGTEPAHAGTWLKYRTPA